jgi:hypothetical protein
MAETANVEVMSQRDIRAEEVRDRIVEVKGTIETNYAELAQLLYEVEQQGYFASWGFERFRDYCEDSEGGIGMGYRKARYLVVIAHAVARSGADWDRVISIGWTKMRTIARLMTPSNKDEWLDRAENSTQDQLLSLTKNVGPGETLETNEETPKIHTLQLRMNEDQHSIISDATATAKRMIDSENTVDALEHICYAWVQQSAEGPTKTDLSTVLGWIERTYAVTLVAEGPQDLNSLLAEEETPEEVPVGENAE